MLHKRVSKKTLTNYRGKQEDLHNRYTLVWRVLSLLCVILHVILFLSHHTVVWGILSLLFFCLFVCFVCFLFVRLPVRISKRWKKARGVKFCTSVGLLSGQVFSPFGEDWLAVSHGGGGISRRPGVGSVDFAGRHLWLRAGVGSADRVVVICGYDGR